MMVVTSNSVGTTQTGRRRLIGSKGIESRSTSSEEGPKTWRVRATSSGDILIQASLRTSFT